MFPGRHSPPGSKRSTVSSVVKTDFSITGSVCQALVIVGGVVVVGFASVLQHVQNHTASPQYDSKFGGQNEREHHSLGIQCLEQVLFLSTPLSSECNQKV